MVRLQVWGGHGDGGGSNGGGSVTGSGTLTEPIYGPVHSGGVGLGSGSGAGLKFEPIAARWLQRIAAPKAVGTTYATTTVARRVLGDATADKIPPRGKCGEVKSPPLLKAWSLPYL